MHVVTTVYFNAYHCAPHEIHVLVQNFSTESYNNPATCTAWRRAVCRGQQVAADEHDMRQVPALQAREMEFPAQLPPAHTGKPVNCMFHGVRVIVSQATLVLGTLSVPASHATIACL